VTKLRDALRLRDKSLSFAGVKLFMRKCGVEPNSENTVAFEEYVKIIGGLLLEQQVF
jgi:hypothetical protein